MTIQSQIVTQTIGILAKAAWCGVIIWGFLKVVDLMVELRVTPKQESEGLDLAEHEERGFIL